MRVRQTEAVFMIVAQGGTYPIRAELKGLGFKWCKERSVWHYQGHASMAECRFLQGFWTDNFGPSVRFRAFKRIDNKWRPVS